MAQDGVIPWPNAELFSWFLEIYRLKNEIHMNKEIYPVEILFTTKCY